MTSRAAAKVPLDAWRVRGRRELLDVPGRIAVWVEEVELPSGVVVDDYYQVALPAFAVAYATTPDDRVIALRQYKHGPRRVSLTFPAGHLALGETPAAAVGRELAEETGYRCGRWQALGAFTLSGNQGAGVGHFFRGLDAVRVAEPRPGEDLEEMAIELLSGADVRQALACGEIAILPHAAIAALALMNGVN